VNRRGLPRSGALKGEYVVPLCLACIFIVFVGTNVPALRHDWYWPPAPRLFPALMEVLGGWHVEGIGSANAYPTDYVLNLILTFLRHFAGGRISFVIAAAAVAAACGMAGWRYALSCGCTRLSASAVAVLVLLNPWVYNEIVAGHMFMVLAYACMLHLLVNVKTDTLERRSALLAVLFMMQQIQFFIVSMAVLSVLCVVRRRLYKPFVFGAVLYLPVCAGIVLDYHDLVSIPYLGKWELGQSVDPSRAPLLLGYFTEYAEQSIATGALVLVWYALAALTAAAALLLFWRKSPPLGPIAVAVVSLAAAEGLKGWLAAPVLWAISSIPETAIYRELYDLLGFTALAYLAVLSTGNAKSRALQYGTVLVACAAIAVWALHPPRSWWVPAQNIPSQQFSPVNHTRFALTPAFQPLSYDGRGAGIDPDWHTQDGATPVNDVFQAFPENAALAAFEQSGNTAGLTSLSVSAIVERKWLKSDWRAIAPQLAAPVRWSSISTSPVTILKNYTPELSVVPRAQTTDGIPVLGSAANFFADMSPWQHSVWSPVPSRYETDMRLAWVDARLTFLALPDLAQPFGGATTTSTTALLPVRGGTRILGFVRGVLYAVGARKPVKIPAGRYAWAQVPAGASALRCRGLCTVALETALPGKVLATMPFSAKRVVGFPLGFKQLAPWLLVAHAPDSAGILRYTVRWSGTWTAFLNGHVLRHLKLDEVFNGWRLPNAAGTLILLHGASLIQFTLEVLAVAYAILSIADKPPKQYAGPEEL
jgi:hypothetical protein